MKNRLKNTLLANSALTTILMVTGVLMVVGFACSETGTPPPSQYVGFWKGSDDTSITIRADGGADYKSSNTSVSGGSVTIDETAKTLKVTFASIGPSFTIDKAPEGNQMTLSGVVYKKGGVATEAVMPEESELQDLARTTVADFFRAVETNDFTALYKKTAKIFQDQYTPEKFKEAFKDFVEKKIYLEAGKVSGLKATFEPSPTFENINGEKGLILTGYYPTTPAKTRFAFKYVKEDGTWKPYNIKVNVNSD